MTDIRQTREYARYMGDAGWIVERFGNAYCYIKKIPILGAIAKIQRPDKLKYGDILVLGKKYRLFQIIVEPKKKSDVSILTRNKFKLNKSSYLPTKTLQINLANADQEILDEFKKDAKYALRKTQNVKIIKVLPRVFHKNWRAVVNWQRDVTSLAKLLKLQKEFGKNCVFLMDEESSFSGGIFLVADKIGYYWQAFTSKQGRRQLIQYKIVYEGILWAKKRGATRFDFEGIEDERNPRKSWRGFSHFKKSFGGQTVSYPGTYTKTLLSFRR